jgi:hypothetical protein
MSNNNYESISSHDDNAEMGNMNMQELGSRAKPSRIIRNRLVYVASLALAVVVVALLVTSTRGIAVSEAVEKISSPVSLLNAVTPATGNYHYI